MNKLPIPMLHGPDEVLTLVQPFHVRAPVDISQGLQVQTVDHLGVDITCGSPQNTWGKECVWPFPWPGIVYDAQVDSQFNAHLHAHSQIDTTDPDTGIKYSLVYLHLSSVTATKTEIEGKVIVYYQGDVIGKVGNNGAVEPMPTPERPYDGSHLHLGLGVKNPGESNYTMVDPLIYFDVNPTLVPDTTQPDIIKNEIQVMQAQTDPTVKAVFLKDILARIISFLGFGK